MINAFKKACPWWVKIPVARLSRTGIILMYHRVSELRPNHFCLNVSPKNFNDHMRIIKKYAKPLLMRQIGENLKNLDLMHDQIAVTFDDGFVDNFHQAKPILEKHEVPATFYISSHAMEYREEFWWDKLSRLFNASSRFPEIFEMSINNTLCRWHIDENSLAKESCFLPPPDSVLSRTQFLFAIWRLIRPLSYEQQNVEIDRILTWSGQTLGQPVYLPMTLDELKQMAGSRLVEIGAHTVHHPLLLAWGIKEQEEEISIGRQKLEHWINKKVTSFAYPFGEYSHDTLDIVERLGFQNACTVTERAISRNMNPFLLPRFMVFDWDGDEFEKNLRYWLTRKD